MDKRQERSIFHNIQARYGIIGESSEILEAVGKLWQAGPTDLTVLITGETGTGKEVFANALHGLSKRKNKPFVSVNCGAIPENLLESELFGHEKGAFTGASERRTGFFETVDGGTIFLDEIGELPTQTQVKLLRVLENGEFSRLGSSVVHRVDVRIITATNRDLKQAVKKGIFRDDLFFRLNSVHIVLPPLRTRPEDIPLLAAHFAQQTATKLGISFEGFSDEAASLMKALPWKGNVRELKNLIETMITLEKASYISSNMLRKHGVAALPAYEYSQIAGEKALTRYEFNEQDDNQDIHLIFKSLLEIKNEITDLKRGLFSLSQQIEQIGDKIEEFESAKYKDTPKSQQAHDFEPMPLDDLERNMISAALEKFGGNRRKASEALGISERTLYRKLKDYDIHFDKD